MNYQRIQIIGNAAGGKTALARSLGQKYSLPITHVDSLQFVVGAKGSLEMRPFKETLALLGEVKTQDRWIIDGYGPLDDLQDRFAIADCIVFLDLPLKTHYFWALNRVLRSIFHSRDELPKGSSEFSWVHIKKLFDAIEKHHRLMRPELVRILQKPHLEKKLYLVSSVAELNIILERGLVES